MGKFAAALSIQEITIKDGVTEAKSPRSGKLDESAVFPVRIGDAVHHVKAIQVTEKAARFHVDDLYLKSRTYTAGVTPADFELVPGQQEIIYFPVAPNIEFQIIFRLLGTLPLSDVPSASPPKINMPFHYFKQIQDLLQKIEHELNTKIFVYYLPPEGMIHDSHPDYFLELLSNSPKYPKISLIIYSNGGDSMAGLRTITLLRHYCDELEIIIPSEAASAATNMSLGADRLLFTPLGYLSAIDTQIINIKDEKVTNYNYTQISSDSFRRAKSMLEKDNQSVEANEKLFQHLHPIVCAEVDRLSFRSKMIATAMMRMHKNRFDDQKIEWIANHLVYDYPAHGYPILYAEAKQIGLNAELLPDNITMLLWELMKYYRAVTQEKNTYLSMENFHKEMNTAIIEMVGKRLVHRYSYDNKYSSIEKKWVKTSDTSNWRKYLPPKSGEKQPQIFNVEIEDPQSTPPIPTSSPVQPVLSVTA